MRATAYKNLPTTVKCCYKYFFRKKSLSMSKKQAFEPVWQFVDLKLTYIKISVKSIL